MLNIWTLWTHFILILNVKFLMLNVFSHELISRKIAKPAKGLFSFKIQHLKFIIISGHTSRSPCQNLAFSAIIWHFLTLFYFFCLVSEWIFLLKIYFLLLIMFKFTIQIQLCSTTYEIEKCKCFQQPLIMSLIINFPLFHE